MADFKTTQIKNSADVVIDPSTEQNQADTLFDYKLSDIEDDTTSYLGYLKKDGAWFIQKLVVSGTGTTITYAKGSSGYNWSNRASETYGSFNSIF